METDLAGGAMVLAILEAIGILVGIGVCIAWIVFPFKVVSRLNAIILRLGKALNSLEHIERMVGAIPVQAPPLPSRMAPAPQEQVAPTDSTVTQVCPQCGASIEFPESRTGETIPCPNCQKLFALYRS